MKDPSNKDESSISEAEKLDSSDERIYPGLARGENQSWEELYHRYKEKLDWFFEVNHVYDKNDRDDLLQETMRALFESFPTYDPTRGALRNWIYGVARFVMLRHQGVYSRIYKNEFEGEIYLYQVSLEGRDPFDDEKAGDDPRVLKLRDALQTLSERDQEVLLLRASRNLTWDELALEKGIGASALKMRYYRALNRLKNAFEG